jgi:hypothetical protein
MVESLGDRYVEPSETVCSCSQPNFASPDSAARE